MGIERFGNRPGSRLGDNEIGGAHEIGHLPHEPIDTGRVLPALRLEVRFEPLVPPADNDLRNIQAGGIDLGSRLCQRTHPLPAANQQDNGFIHRPAQIPAQCTFLYQRLAIAVRDRQPHHAQFLGRHTVFQGTLACRLGWDQDQVGAVVIPERVRGDHIRDHVDERRALCAQGFQRKRIRKWMDGDDQVCRVSFHKGLGCLAGDRPHGSRDHARPGPSIGGMEAGAPQFRRLDHIWIHLAGVIEWKRCIILEEIHHLGGDLVPVFTIDRFNNGFGRGTMAAAGIGEIKDDVRFFRGWIVHLCCVG